MRRLPRLAGETRRRVSRWGRSAVNGHHALAVHQGRGDLGPPDVDGESDLPASDGSAFPGKVGGRHAEENLRCRRVAEELVGGAAGARRSRRPTPSSNQLGGSEASGRKTAISPERTTNVRSPP